MIFLVYCIVLLFCDVSTANLQFF